MGKKCQFSLWKINIFYQAAKSKYTIKYTMHYIVTFSLISISDYMTILSDPI